MGNVHAIFRDHLGDTKIMRSQHLFAFKVSRSVAPSAKASGIANTSPVSWSPLEYDSQTQLWQGRGTGTAAAETLFCSEVSSPCGKFGGNWWWQSDDTSYHC
jgi:hypothetical protein